MIVDYNLFEPGAQELPDYLLTVCLRGQGIQRAGVGEYICPLPPPVPTRKRWVLPVPVGVIRDMASHGRHGGHTVVLWG
jgi:hypothetical protein